MTAPLPAHSHIGASGMYRWAPCPGSVRLAKTVPNRTTSYAAEGTCAHDVASACLLKRVEPSAFLNEVREVEGHTITVDEEMVEGVGVYVDYIEALVASDSNADLLVEHKFNLSAVFPGLFGTADAVVYLPSISTLVVADLKYGAGKGVEVEGNQQLDYYALGALLTAGFKVSRVRKVIVQPRYPHPAGPIRQDEIDAIDLLDFRADLIQYAKATEVPDAPLVPGDHCGFCPAAGVCPALHSQATQMAKLEFTPAKVYDPAELSKALVALPMVEAYIKNLREFAYREAEAGRCPPGWKLVAKRGTRKWKSQGDVIEALQDLGAGPDVMYEPRDLRSPAQLEKAGVNKKFVAQFTELVSSGHTLAPEDDKREAAKPSAQVEFAGIPLDN